MLPTPLLEMLSAAGLASDVAKPGLDYKTIMARLGQAKPKQPTTNPWKRAIKPAIGWLTPVRKFITGLQGPGLVEQQRRAQEYQAQALPVRDLEAQ